VDRRKYPFSLATIIIIVLTMGSLVWSDDWTCYSWDKDTKNCRQYYNQKVEHTKNIVKVQTRLPITHEIRTTVDGLKDDDSPYDYFEDHGLSEWDYISN
jgi:hypothetical protein